MIENSIPPWEDFLIGKFISTAPHVATIHVIVNKIWPLGDKTIKVDVFVVDATTVKFWIKDSSVRARILRRGMWNIYSRRSHDDFKVVTSCRGGATRDQINLHVGHSKERSETDDFMRWYWFSC